MEPLGHWTNHLPMVKWQEMQYTLPLLRFAVALHRLKIRLVSMAEMASDLLVIMIKAKSKKHHLDHKGFPDWTNLIPMDSHFAQTNV
jgi:hypothetical protein